jgi:methylated-DNA-protein-cysteine methyltransferase-like protein
LRREGVEVSEDSMGQYTVDLKDYGWFPEMLPSEADAAESSSGEDENEEDEAAYHT